MPAVPTTVPEVELPEIAPRPPEAPDAAEAPEQGTRPAAAPEAPEAPAPPTPAPEPEAPAMPLPQPEALRPAAQPIRFRARDIVVLVAAVALAIAGLVAARIGVHGPPEAYTQLWVQGGGATPMQIGVQSHEAGAVAYRLDLVVNGRVVDSSDFSLEPGAQQLTPAPSLRPGSTFEARLARAADPTAVYRRVLVHIPESTPPPSETTTPSGTPAAS